VGRWRRAATPIHSGFAFSADYYDIKIEGAIGSVAAQTIVDRCAEGVQAFCSAVVRGPNAFGNSLQVFESPFNFASQRAKALISKARIAFRSAQAI
jgi:iron complex outermembrane receptor protein